MPSSVGPIDLSDALHCYSASRVVPPRLVWAIEFSDDFVICPPDGSPCWSPRPATVTVYLDDLTGAFLESASYAPSP